MKIDEKLQLLRTKMSEHDIDAYLIPSADAHISEYVAPHWKCREWISGFSGSMGTVIVTADFAGLWVDSRYFIQATKQLAGSTITLFKLNTEDTPDYPEWLLDNLEEGSRLGFDGNVFSYTQAESLNDSLEMLGAEFVFDHDLVGEIWTDRPAIPRNKIFIHEEKYAGLPLIEKLRAVLEVMDENGADSHVISALDDIAWLYNIRGCDIEYNPVAIAYSIITQDKATLFIYSDKLDEKITKHLTDAGVTIEDYDNFTAAVNKLRGNVLLDDSKTNYKTSMVLDGNDCIIIEGMNPTTEMKARKNTTELRGFEAAHLRDGVAMVRFHKWLKENVGKIAISEISVAEKLREFRAMGDNYVGESFGTIVGYKENGAIVHYTATPESDAEIMKEGFLLIDSGGQYFDGTTDITRMYYLGETANEAEKSDYTNILKGHIALSKAVFPEGTRGAQLDVLARQFIWQDGKNYLHGTGHGVGCFLNVHEGPQGIRMEENPTALAEGMIITNEPGVYIEGQYGIRIENCLQVCLDKDTEFGRYLNFQPITMCPISMKAVDVDLLSKEDIDWLNAYHAEVYGKLSPSLDESERDFLKEKTKAITPYIVTYGNNN